MALGVARHGTDRAGFVAQVMLGGVGIFKTAAPGGAFTLDDEIFSLTEWNSIFGREFFCARADQHHVLAFFINTAGQTNGIQDAFDGGNRAGFQRGAIHQDGVELYTAVAIQVRTDTRVERGIIFERDNGGFDGVNRAAVRAQNFPADLERAADSFAAIIHCLLGDVPGAAVNDQGRFQGFR